jgi:hypothetical protein
MKQTLWKNNLSFVKDVAMVCVNLIITVIVVAGKRVGGIIFVPLLLPN